MAEEEKDTTTETKPEAAVDVETTEAGGEGEPEEKKLVLASGAAADIFGDSDSTFVPALKEDMPLAQRKQAVRDTMKQAVMMDDRLNLVSGELLYETHKNEYWKEWVFEDVDTGEMRGFVSFDEYVEAELDMKKRKAYYLISIYETFVVKLGLPTEVLRDLEWSKAKELVSVITTDNWVELLDKIKGLSVKKVQALVAELKGVGKAGGKKEPGEATVRISAVLHPDQAVNVQQALKLAEGMTGSDKVGNQLDLICSDFMAGSIGSGLTGALERVDLIIATVKRAFGVTLKVADVDAERMEALDAATTKAEKEKAAAAAAAE